jgi:hypothetical protein
MDRVIRKNVEIKYSTKEIPCIDNVLTEFMSTVFREWHKLQNIMGDSSNIIRVSDEPLIYNIILYKTDNPMHIVRYDSFINKVYELAKVTNCLPDKLFIIKDYENYHPEIREGEVFLGNMSEDTFRTVGWRTKRRGNVAYYINGEIIRNSSSLPVFCQQKERIDRAGEFRYL